jgi:hypothetical protein
MNVSGSQQTCPTMPRLSQSRSVPSISVEASFARKLASQHFLILQAKAPRRRFVASAESSYRIEISIFRKFGTFPTCEVCGKDPDLKGDYEWEKAAQFN